MTQLEERRTLDRSEDTFRLVSTLQMLLAVFAPTLSALFRNDTMDFFCSLAAELDAARCGPAVCRFYKRYTFRCACYVRTAHTCER